MTAWLRPVRVRVHERGDKRLDGILRLIEEAGRPMPLPTVLATLAEEIARIMRIEVVSIYVREDEGDLVMRANVGFAPGAVGHVRLRAGEGLTGMAAECLRPVSVAMAPEADGYKHVPGLGEEHYPAYLGVPLLVGGACAGVLVLQRREAREWDGAEVAIATALAAPVCYAIERARARAASSRDPSHMPTARAARLTGVAVAPGAGLGRAELLPLLDEMRLGGRGVATPGDAVALAFASMARELDRARRRLEPALPPEAVKEVRSLALVLDDARLRDLAITECARAGVALGLRKVAREYARAAWRVGIGAEAWHTERAEEIEDLCVLVATRASGQRVPGAGSVLVAERLSAFLVLTVVARKADGIVVAGRAESPLGEALATAAGVPVVSEVAGLFAWARPGDRILVDGHAGLVRVNPPETAVARYRARSER